MLMLAALLLTLADAPAVEPPLHLSCAGYTDTPTAHSSLHFLAKGGLSTTTYYGSRRDSQNVLFEMSDGQARIHMPKGLVTDLSSGGEDGWWKVADLKVTDGAIRGWFRVNFVNKPSFTIDRTTGDIDLGGAFPFRGSCEKSTQTERKF